MTQKQSLIGFSLGGVRDTADETCNEDRTVIVSDTTIVLCRGEDGRAGTVTKFDTFFQEEPSLIQLFKQSALNQVDELVTSGQSGGMLVCGGTDPTSNHHVHNIVYAMAIFSLDTLLLSLSSSNATSESLGTPDTHSASSFSIVVSWYATFANDDEPGRFDQVDVLAACKFSAITETVTAPPSVPLSSSTLSQELLSVSSTSALKLDFAPAPHISSKNNSNAGVKRRQLFRLNVSSATHMQEIIRRVQQNPQLAPILRSPNAHHAIVLGIQNNTHNTGVISSELDIINSISLDSTKSQHTMSEFTFMWLGADLAGQMTLECETGARFFADGTQEAHLNSPFPHLRSILRRDLNLVQNSSVAMVLSGLRRDWITDQAMLRLANQYSFGHFINCFSDNVSNGTKADEYQQTEPIRLPANIQCMLQDVAAGGAPATYWFTKVLKLYHQSHRTVHQMQEENMRLRITKLVLQSERNCALDAIIATSTGKVKQKTSSSPITADTSSLLMSLGMHDTSPIGNHEHTKQPEILFHEEDSASQTSNGSEARKSDHTNPIIDQRSLRNLLTFFRSQLRKNAIALEEQAQKNAVLHRKVQSLEASSQTETTGNFHAQVQPDKSPLRKVNPSYKSNKCIAHNDNTIARKAQALQTELVTEMRRRRELEVSVTSLEHELTMERDYIKSEQRRFRRQLKYLKSRLSTSEAVCNAAHDTLLEKVRQVPVSGILVESNKTDRLAKEKYMAAAAPFQENITHISLENQNLKNPLQPRVTARHRALEVSFEHSLSK